MFLKDKTTLRYVAIFSTWISIFLLGNLMIANGRNRVDDDYLVLKLVKGVDPPLREWTQYTVRNREGDLLTVRSDMYDWPEDLHVHSRVSVKNKIMYVDGKEDYSSRVFQAATRLVFGLEILTSLVALSSCSLLLINRKKQ
ncbi:MAG: hypothetical protein EOP06_12090 [Proteobacteria bacterium]|nr:MAG: hypothetical protein EOP06_12090 [Pseudomonadota bacterium]